MMKPWRKPFERSEPLANAIRNVIPRLETDRLILRAPTLTDWDVLEPIWITDRAKFIGGPFNEEDAYFDFCQSVAGWSLRGFGSLTIQEKQSGDVIGLTGLFNEFGDPEHLPEIGWLLIEAAEGKGYAQEAAKAVREFAFETLGFDQLISYIYAGNTPSIAVATKLGAVADAVDPAKADEPVAYRHFGNQSSSNGSVDQENHDTSNGGQT